MDLRRFKPYAIGAFGVSAISALFYSLFQPGIGSVYAAVYYDTAFAGLQTEAEAGINAILPIALGVFGILAAIAIGMRIFRKVTGK